MGDAGPAQDTVFVASQGPACMSTVDTVGALAALVVTLNSTAS